MSGDWPPHWDDAEDLPWTDDQMDTETGARLSAVAAYLAAVPVPDLPDAFEARISAAIASEAADRGSLPAAADPAPDAGRLLAPRHQVRARLRRGLRSGPALLAGSALACLVLLGFGFLLSHGTSSSSSSAASSALAVPSAAASGPAPGANEAGPVSSASATAGAAFSVTESGTAYQKSTLAAQVRAELAGMAGSSVSVPGPAPTSSSAASSGTRTASAQLRGCVLQLTSGATPGLVDRATYRGEEAYIIATTGHVWVVRLGCSAANPELIISASLAG
jgi:hypothetical protein